LSYWFQKTPDPNKSVLDKFLQILEDGRLTDGHGDTVFFSEAVIIFTSNLGVYIEDETGQRVLNVSPEEPFAQVERKLRDAIEHHFRFQLQRPELLNRIGDNIVVFDFIRQPMAKEIFEQMAQNVVERVRDEHGVALEIPEAVREMLMQWCTEDLAHGGRGIGNRLETTFINPLARALFEESLASRHTYTVRRIIVESGIYSVELA
jgi:ATP-dependent Clp protease ATP-binding subunit ClpA